MNKKFKFEIIGHLKSKKRKKLFPGINYTLYKIKAVKNPRMVKSPIR